MSIGGLPPGLRRVPRLMGGAVPGQGADAADAPAAPEFSNRFVAAGTTSTEALTSNPRRAYLLVQNRGTNAVYLVFGTKATVNAGIELVADGAYEPFLAPGSSMSLITATGTSNIVIIEGLKL